ncbi:carbon-nitrogen hydrolase family protein [Nonomuraea zeae]|uniref:Carbon-nitrogen hydrolase family protein n=1 Tax=Nonomuraea zeae TaxID=1642303 RepID=A0A5S4H054_9ACTN|nr:carbon-nitrogen hydrolase family protein [Nonomuraea zeae]TMR38547.1 carbon-nitrogen hydrolase family protein [Nonomuraea zeae]
MSSETLIVAVAQQPARPGDVSANARAAATAIETAAAAGAKLLLFPELSLVGYDLDLFAGPADPAVLVTENDPRLDQARQAAKDHGLTAVLGAACRRPDGEVWIASLALLPGGELYVHGKRNLHGRERELFQPGGEGRILDVDGWRVALTICYDAGVPAHAADAARRGAEVYAGSVLYTMAETRRFDLHFAARAMDHRMYAVAANYPDAGPGWVSCGGSGVWHPDGTRLTQAPTGPGLFTAELSRAELRALREKDARAGYPRGAA